MSNLIKNSQYGKISTAPIEIDIFRKQKSSDVEFGQLEIEQSESNNKREVNDANIFEEIINNSGFTLLQVKAITFTGLIYFIEGLHVSLTWLIFSPIINEFNISPLIACVILSSIIFFISFGSMFTEYFTGLNGRKNVLIISLVIILLSTILSFFQFIIVVYFTRGLIGFCLGLILPITTNNLLEILPRKFRSFWIVTVTSFFSIGSIFSCVFLHFLYLRIKVLFIILSLPSFVILITYALFYQDNPRYLIMNGYHEEGFEIIEFFLNKGKKLDEQERVKIIKGIDFGMNKEVKYIGKIQFIFRRFFKITIILSIIWVLFSIMTTGSIFNFFIQITTSSSSSSKEDEINNNDNTKQFFSLLNYFILYNLFFAVSTITAGLFTEIKLVTNKKYILIFCFTLSTFICIIPFFQSNPSFLLFSISSFFINISINVTNSFTIHYYPQRIRDFALLFFSTLSHLTGFISTFLSLYINSNFPNWVFSLNTLICFIGISSTFLLPFDNTNRELERQLTGEKQVENKAVDEIII